LRRPNFEEASVTATRAADVPTLHFHDLCHVGDTPAANTGANLRELMARMGHASPQEALIYQHATKERDRVIAEIEPATHSSKDRPDPSTRWVSVR
jgi:integrase